MSRRHHHHHHHHNNKNGCSKTAKNGSSNTAANSGTYNCQFCDKTFPRLGYLKKHEQVKEI